MSQHDIILEVLQASAARQADRRRFIKFAGAGTVAVSGASLLAGCSGGNNRRDPDPVATGTPLPTEPTVVSDGDVLNFALNLEYLEAQFYSFAAFGVGLPPSLLTGTGQQGAVTGGRQVPFRDPLVAQYAREIANDERAHVAFLRQAIGSSAVAQPAIDISATRDGAFSVAARAAGLIDSTQVFDPYSSDETFLLGAYIFEDVGVTAYKGASPLIQNDTFLEAAAGILAAEAYHAGLVRTVLFRKGIDVPDLVTATEAISNARDSLDGPTDLDQGVASRATPFGVGSNIVPTDANSVAYSRTTRQVLNIAYLNAMAADRGGFFPNGVNGALRLSGG